MRINLRKAGAVSLHILFWTVVLLPQYWVISTNENIPDEVLYYALISGFFLPVTFYIFFFYVVPYTLERKVKRIYSISVYFVFAVALITLKSGILIIVNKLTDLDFNKHELLGLFQQLSDILSLVFVIVIAVLVRIAMYWFRDQKNRTELALREHQLELELLKAQVNPHFFFNTLNNIYSLVYKKSDHAPAAVMKLSEIMRYLIYESKSEMVPLDKEVEQLENYIELERLRTRDPDFISFFVRGDLSGHVIPPMLLITFAENAFKHGKRKVKNPGIIIIVTAGKNQIMYEVINYILNEPLNNHTGEGIGMQNTRRRLELLYPDCHRLEIKQDGEKHEVKLELKCNNERKILK